MLGTAPIIDKEPIDYSPLIIITIIVIFILVKVYTSYREGVAREARREAREARAIQEASRQQERATRSFRDLEARAAWDRACAIGAIGRASRGYRDTYYNPRTMSYEYYHSTAPKTYSIKQQLNKQNIKKRNKTMTKLIEMGANGTLTDITGQSVGSRVSTHSLITLDDSTTAAIVTKGKPLTALSSQDLMHLKATYGDLKVTTDIAEDEPKLFKEVAELQGYYIIFSDESVVDVTHDEDIKPASYKTEVFQGVYYYNLHTSQLECLNTLPDGYRLDNDRTHEGIQCMYNPSKIIECSVCGSVTVSEDTCGCRDKAKDLWASSNNGLNSYNYVPEFDFRTLGSKDEAKATFGIELEMVAPHKEVHPNMSPAFASDDFLYLMSDGSLPSLGVEMACHPFSFKWYKEQQDPFRLKLLKHIGMESKKYNQCGLHIHISKTTFKSDDHFDAWYRLLTCNLIYLEKLCGRTCGEYNKSCSFPMSSKKKLEDNTNRTDAIANRGKTIEFRMLKGNIDKVEFGVEMLQATIEYSKTVKKTVAWTRFKKWLSTRLDTYPNLEAIFIDKKVPKGVFSIPETNDDWLSDFEGA